MRYTLRRRSETPSWETAEMTERLNDWTTETTTDALTLRSAPSFVGFSQPFLCLLSFFLSFLRRKAFTVSIGRHIKNYLLLAHRTLSDPRTRMGEKGERGGSTRMHLVKSENRAAGCTEHSTEHVRNVSRCPVAAAEISVTCFFFCFCFFVYSLPLSVPSFSFFLTFLILSPYSVKLSPGHTVHWIGLHPWRVFYSKSPFPKRIKSAQSNQPLHGLKKRKEKHALCKIVHIQPPISLQPLDVHCAAFLSSESTRENRAGLR